MGSSRKLSPEQEQRVCRLIRYGNMTYRQIADQFHVSLSCVRAIASRNGLARRERNDWLPEELRFLKDNYERLGATRTANALMRHPNPQAVCHKARELGLTANATPYGRGRHARLKVIEGGAHEDKAEGHRHPHGVED